MKSLQLYQSSVIGGTILKTSFKSDKRRCHLKSCLWWCTNSETIHLRIQRRLLKGKLPLLPWYGHGGLEISMQLHAKLQSPAEKCCGKRDAFQTVQLLQSFCVFFLFSCEVRTVLGATSTHREKKSLLNGKLALDSRRRKWGLLLISGFLHCKKRETEKKPANKVLLKCANNVLSNALGESSKKMEPCGDSQHYFTPHNESERRLA